METERREYFKEKIREGMRERGEEVDEGKVERIVPDLITLAEIFVGWRKNEDEKRE